MTRAELAAALDISRAMVSKLERRGMPVDSLEAALRWRRRHLEPSRVKGTRADTRAAPAAVAVAAADAVALRLVAALADRFHAAPDAIRPALQAALADVPPRARSRVRLPMDVWGDLLGDQLSVLGWVADADAVAAQSDQDEEAAGALLFALVAGDLRATPDGGLEVRTAAGRMALADAGLIDLGVSL